LQGGADEQIGDCDVARQEEQNILPLETDDTVADAPDELAERPELFAHGSVA
jgi:hypothetical protein